MTIVPPRCVGRRDAASSVAHVSSGYERSLRPCLALVQRTPTTKDIRKGALVAVAVDDAAAPEVVGRELDLDPVAREDPDPVAAHLSGRVPEGLVAVVERDAEEAVPERLDHFALHLDLVFLVALLGRNRVSQARLREKRYLLLP